MKKVSKIEAKKQIEKFFLDIKDKSPKEIKKIKKFAMGNNIPLEKLRKKLLDKNKLRSYKMHPKMLGSPDFVFPKKKLVIFIDGDFWHGRNFSKNRNRLPKKYWREKIESNIRRDKKNRMKLKKQGWKVLRVWEHEVEKNLPGVITKIQKITNYENRKH
jgi:DNA mismatch endonuclease (patch repair protein)